MNDEVTNEPSATGWLRTELRGDTEQAKGFVRDARKLLGAMKIIYGVNDRVAQGESGGFYKQSVQLPNGSVMEAITNNGNDTIRITTRGAQQQSAEDTTLTGQSSKSTVQGESRNFVATHHDTPIELPVLISRTSEEEGEEIVYDEPLIQYSLWIVFTSDTDYSLTLKEWTFLGGYTGQSAVLQQSSTPGVGLAGNTGLAITDGFVWGVHSEGTIGTIFRQDLKTGVSEDLYTYSAADAINGAASTVTPEGVLFAIGRLTPKYILINNDGTVGFAVSNNTRVDAGVFGETMTSFANDGTHAYLHYTDTGGSPRGMTIIDVQTGANSTVNMTAQGFETPDDYRMGNGAFAAISNGTMYGVANQSNMDPPYTPTKIFRRDPSSNTASAELADITFFGSGDPDYGLFTNGAATLTEAGDVVCADDKTFIVIDPITKAIESNLSVQGLWGSLVHTGSGPNVHLNRGASIIPGGDLVALHYQEYDASFNFVAGHLATYDVQSGVATDYNLGLSYGYLVQVTVTPATNPDPADPLIKQEWEYLSSTSINPI